MKTLRMMAGLLTAILCLGLTACSDDDNEGVNVGDIVGRWEITHDEGWELYQGEREYWDEDVSGEFVTFNSNGTVIITFEDEEETANYTVSGTTLVISFNGKTETAIIESLNSTSMVLTYEEPNQYFQRYTFTKR